MGFPISHVPYARESERGKKVTVAVWRMFGIHTVPAKKPSLFLNHAILLFQNIIGYYGLSRFAHAQIITLDQNQRFFRRNLMAWKSEICFY